MLHKKEMLIKAIEDADQMISPLPSEQYQVPALTSLRIRHLLNSIGKLGTKYLEVGVHKGGTFTASVAGSDNLNEIVAVDSFESDATNTDQARPEFEYWAKKFVPSNSKFELIVSDSFQVDLKKLPKNFDIYLYDGDHSTESQEKALTYYKDVLADVFIFLCDDFDWDEVQKGTQNGIEKAGLEVVYEKYLKSVGDHNNESWWNGFYVAILKKKKKAKKNG